MMFTSTIAVFVAYPLFTASCSQYVPLVAKVARVFNALALLMVTY